MIISGCTGTYSDSVTTTIPGKFAAILSDVLTLQSVVIPLKSCMTNPSDPGLLTSTPSTLDAPKYFLSLIILNFHSIFTKLYNKLLKKFHVTHAAIYKRNMAFYARNAAI